MYRVWPQTSVIALLHRAFQRSNLSVDTQEGVAFLLTASSSLVGEESVTSSTDEVSKLTDCTTSSAPSCAISSYTAPCQKGQPQRGNAKGGGREGRTLTLCTPHSAVRTLPTRPRGGGSSSLQESLPTTIAPACSTKTRLGSPILPIIKIAQSYLFLSLKYDCRLRLAVP